LIAKKIYINNQVNLYYYDLIIVLIKILYINNTVADINYILMIFNWANFYKTFNWNHLYGSFSWMQLQLL